MSEARSRADTARHYSREAALAKADKLGRFADLSEEQIIGVAFYGNKLSRAAHVIGALDAIEDSPSDKSVLRDHHLKEIKRHVTDLASELGYKLVPIEAGA